MIRFDHIEPVADGHVAKSYPKSPYTDHRYCATCGKEIVRRTASPHPRKDS